MAYIRYEYCNACEQTKQHVNERCIDCKERERREETAAWQAKTVQEKLLDLHQRVRKLEKGPTIY